MFVSKIALFFSEKETETNIPVCIQIRPLVNGYPHPSKIVPLSEKYLYPSDIAASSVPTATEVQFSTPVYLTPGEYAIVITSNSNRYSLHMAQEGQIQYGTTDQRISVGSDIGSLFKPQNGQQYTMTDTEDLAFVIYRANFGNSGSFRLVTDPTSDYVAGPGVIYVNAAYNNINSLIPSNTTVVCGALTTPSSNANIEPNKTMILDIPTSYAAGVDTDFVSIYFNGNSQVSPCVDLDRTREHWIQYIIQDTGPTGPHTSTSAATNSQYVSKNVILGNGFSATNLHVYLNAYNPTDSEIQVWAKYLPQGNTSPMENRNWEKLTVVSDKKSNNETDYKELQYRFATDVEEFTVFAVKIMLLSSVSNSRVPVIRNARILATV
jgi:hypothetical protein